MTARAEARSMLSALAVGVVLTVACFPDAVFGGGIFIARDVLRVHYPLHAYWAARVASGEFPRWFPYDGLGEPFPGMLVAGAFHPLNLLYLALPLGAAMTVNVLVCFPLGFLGAWALARRFALAASSALLAGVVFSFGGYPICVTNNLPYLMAAATVPWALWAADRFFVSPTPARALGTACLLALVLFAGDPQSFVVTGALVVAITAARHPTGVFRAAAGLLVLTALVAAVQLVPALQLAAESKLATQSLGDAEAWSVHPLRILDLAFGPVFASESGDAIGAAVSRGLLLTSRNSLWANSLHVGLPTLMLAAVALVARRRSPRAWLVVACTAALALLALGKHTPVYGLVFSMIPPWRAFRYPEKLAPFVVLGLALGAAAGLDLLRGDERRRWQAIVAFALGVALAVGMVLVERLAGGLSRAMIPLWQGAPPRAAVVRLATALVHQALVSGVAAFVVVLVLLLVRGAEARAALVIVVVFVHLAVVNAPLHETAPARVLHPGAFADVIRAADGPPRLGGARVFRVKGGYGTDYAHDPELALLDEPARFARSVDTALDPVTPGLWGLEGANTYLPSASRRVTDLTTDESEFAAHYAALLGVRWVSVSKDDVRDLGRGLRVVARHQPLRLVLAVPAAVRPRVALVRPRCVGTRAAARQLLRRIPSRPTRPSSSAWRRCPSRPPARRSARRRSCPTRPSASCCVPSRTSPPFSCSTTRSTLAGPRRWTAGPRPSWP